MPEPPPLSPLPSPPRIALDVARDRTAESRASGGFVNVRRVDLIARYPDGSTSAPFAYDVVERAAIDAVVLVAYERAAGEDGGGGERQVYVRSSVRAPLALRRGIDLDASNLWELPAGIVDATESPREAAAREIEEELGYRVTAASLVEFAPWSWPSPGFIAERHFFFCVDVTALQRGTPTEDGSALERAAAIEKRPLSMLLALCRAGGLRDAKTELALRRFAEHP